MNYRKDDVYEKLLGELFEAYPDDPSSPGIVTALIRTRPRRRYYASVVRYLAPLGEERVVVHSTRGGPELKEVVQTLAEEWRNKRG